ncbi:MAG: DUF11 domain-containing protein [Clostridia bacterium]|nr:DUF11 domain-containing protein [Clostridia bacterium]
MNRKRLFLALALGVVLVLLCASVALAERPIKVSMEFSKYKLSGPETITVSITVTNIGDGDLPAPVTLYYPNGEKIDDFGSPTLSVGKSKRWTGDWDVTQEELNEGKVTFSVRYSAYDGEIGDDGEPKLKGHKLNFSKDVTNLGADPQITVKRSIVPTTAQKGQEVSVTYEVTNSGDVEVTSVNIKENAAVSAKSGTINSIAVGATESYTFTTTMGTKDITSAATISYKAGGKGYTKKVESTTIKHGEVKLSATLKTDKKGGAPGETIKLTLTLKNSGTLDFTNVTVTDPSLGTVFEGQEVKAGKELTLEKDLTITETQELQFTVKADESTGKGVETATGRVKITAMDPSQLIALRVEATADREVIYKRPGTVRFSITVHNDSTVEVKNINVKSGDVTLYSFDSIPAGQSASFIRDVDANLGDDMSSGTFRFVASCKDQLDQVLKFESNDVVINYVEQTPVPTTPPQVTPPKPAEEPLPTDQPEPEWLGQAELLADGAKWIFAGIAGVLLILLLIGAVRRGKSRSESKKAMDHLEGSAIYRDYSTAPKRGQRSEISNGGAGEDKAAEEEKPEVKEEVENTVQSSELMAETLRKLYSDKTEDTAEAVTETVEEAVEEKAEAAAEAAETVAEEAAEAVEEGKKAEEEAGGARRRRGRKQG